MSIVPVITATDLQNHFGRLISKAGLGTAALQDFADSAIAEIKRYLGYNPQVDSSTGLASLTETLNGGRPLITLKALVDDESDGSILTVTELGQELTRRTGFSSPASGDYYLDDYELYRLAAPGARQLGIWCSNVAASTPGFTTAGNLGGNRTTADYTDSYRGGVTVTYTPAIDISLVKGVAIELCKLSILNADPTSSVSVGSRSKSYNIPENSQANRSVILERLPIPMQLGTGS